MHTPSALIVHSIGHMDSSKFIHTTMVTQVTHPPSHTSQISTPYIGGQSSMGGQPSTRRHWETFSHRKYFYWGETYMVATSKRLGESHSYNSLYTYYHWNVSWTSISRSFKTFLGSTQFGGNSFARNYALSICKPHKYDAIVPSFKVYGRSIRTTKTHRGTVR